MSVLLARRVKLAVLAGLWLAACGGGDDGGAPDAAEARYHVGGVVSGLWDGDSVPLRLEHDGRVDTVDVAANGAFRFDTDLSDRTAYQVSLGDDHPCDLARAAGTVAGADDDDVEVRCADPVAVDVTLSAPVPWTFDRSAARNVVDLSIVTQRLRVTVTAPGATIAIDGVAVESGAPSAPLVLPPGERVVAIEVARGPAHRTWELALRRGARPLAEVAFLEADTPGDTDRLGSALAMDDDELLAGAPWYDVPQQRSGAAFRFARDGATWSTNGLLASDPTRMYAEMSSAIALCGDTLVIGAPLAGGAYLEQGIAYVFERDGAGWTQRAALVASNAGFTDHFASSVACDGDTIVVGAPAEDSGARNVGGNQADETARDSGAVYVFERSGATWRQQAYLKARNLTGGFGGAVAIEGDTLVVGAWGDLSGARGIDGDPNDVSASSSGAVHVFRRTAGVWAPEAYVKPSNTYRSQYFGTSVAISGDRFAVGAMGDVGAGPGIDGNQQPTGLTDSGAVFVFRRTPTSWAQEAYVKAATPSEYARFGGAVALRGDVLGVGAYGHSRGAAGINAPEGAPITQAAGAAYVFHRVDATWTEDAHIKASNLSANAWFGRAVALSDLAFAIGAPQESTALQWSGAVYVVQ